MVLVVLVDQGEGHGQVGERVGGQEQGEAAQVQFVDAKRAAEEFQDLAAVLGHVELPGVVVEHVVDEPRGEVEEELAAERLQGPLDAHAVLEDAVEHEVADLVVVEGPGEDALGGVAEGRAAAAPGAVLAAGDLQVGDGLVGDGADGAGERPFAAAEFAAVRARGLLGGGVNRYNDGCGCFGAPYRQSHIEVGDLLEGHGAEPCGECPLAPADFAALRARGFLGCGVDRYNEGVGAPVPMLASLVKGPSFQTHSPGRRPYLSRPKRVTTGHLAVVFSEKSQKYSPQDIASYSGRHGRSGSPPVRKAMPNGQSRSSAKQTAVCFSAAGGSK